MISNTEFHPKGTKSFEIQFKIYLIPPVKYGFHGTDFHKTCYESINFCRCRLHWFFFPNQTKIVENTGEFHLCPEVNHGVHGTDVQ